MFNGKLNQFCKNANEVAVSKGFWDSMHKSVNDQDDAKTKKAIKDAFIAQKISLVMSECGEALEAMRKDNYGLEKKDSFEDEIADAFIRLSDLCGELNIDIEKQIAWKSKLNSTRPALHGKNF